MAQWQRALRRNAATAARRGNSLQRKLAIATAVGGLCTLVLAALVIARSFGTFMAARQNLHDISAYRGVLDAANVLSAERGPANSVLGEPPLADSAARARLRAMRALSDAALQRLAAPPAPPFGLHSHHLPALMVERVRERLQRARAEIDQLAARPLAERDMDAIRHAIESMFNVVDMLQPAIAWQVRELSACHEGLAAAALTGKMLGDLREYGGRIASQIMAPVAARQPMPVQSLVDATRSRGRLLELWQLAGPAYNMFGDSPALDHAYADTNHQFFGQGMAMIDSLVAQGRASGHYSMTPEELTNRYVRTLEPLERLRRVFLDEVVAHFAATRAQALRELAAACGATALILAVLGYTLVFAQRSVFLPLLRARDEVIGLAEERGHPDYASPPAMAPRMATRATEMRPLFDAIDILRRKLRERASLTAQLEHQARTDSLTGLLNRRALELVAARYPAQHSASLVLIDVDRFKQINDRHGHAAGDEVLREVATLMRALVPPESMLARFGGEEFALLLPHGRPGEAAAQAEALRAALARAPVRMPGGKSLQVTASFGVAIGHGGARHWQQLFAAADAAMYRAKAEGRNCVREAQCNEEAPAA
ncbi:GGDEF domain-containing protein [Cupriavidus sp. AcVe19-1a]|uniref:GGDEF domain-containing protein n=1 Tax=Cupriavidus sp. AcVe19-1a TaxID=2821359 RepID=UPI001AE47DD5|nr:GGDEF domain-containing protein [Cupriavidus sp. AcVe19-1a]MBP0631531.1 GGDEF domain-containing protein [Cupriavidus sp. AcVe19-1a]